MCADIHSIFTGSNAYDIPKREQELTIIEMSKKTQPIAEIITTIIQESENTTNANCVPYINICSQASGADKCCRDYRCTRVGCSEPNTGVCI
jgi:hypothetical protein